MKKTIGLVGIAAIISIAALIIGCGTIGNGKIDTVSPYKAGRLFVVTDLITEPVQPKEVAEVVDQVYALAEVDFSAHEMMTDELIKAQIDELYPDTTPEFRQMIYNVYDVLKIRLIDQVESNVSIPDIEVVSEFMRGVKDAAELYRSNGE